MKNKLPLIPAISIILTGIPISVFASDTARHNGPFDVFVQNIYNSYLFQRYISTWGAPLNNASFIAVLILIVIGLVILSAVELFLNYRKSRRILKANSEKLEKRRQQEAEDALLREYMRFKMIAETNGVSDMQNVSFEQWLKARVDSGQLEMSSLTPKQREAVQEANEVAEDIKETVSKKVSSVIPKKQKEMTEDEEIDTSIAARAKEEERLEKIKEREEEQNRRIEEMRKSRSMEPVTVIKQDENASIQSEDISENGISKNTGGSWLNNVEALKRKYGNETKPTELVDLPDMDDVPLSEGAIVKPVAVKEKPKKKEVVEVKETVDVNKLLEEKTAEMTDDMGEVLSADEQTTFDQLVAALNQQRIAENKAKALSAQAEAAKEANIEILQNNLEESFDDAFDDSTSQKSNKEDKALEEAKKRALKEAMKEEQQRRVRPGKR